MEHQLQVVEVQGVHGFIDDKGVAWLNVEDVARGLGFVEAKKFSTSGENYIRWERINGYLAEYDYPPVKTGDFIPENIFYLLAMKASNEVAKKFQLKIANEILPTIRRTGSYGLVNKNDTVLQELVALGRDRLNFEREQFNLANSEESKIMAKVQLLRELASASKDDNIRNELVRHAAKLLIGEDFVIPTWNGKRVKK